TGSKKLWQILNKARSPKRPIIGETQRPIMGETRLDYLFGFL
ncbi:986_t:CDS:2, partial [Racocetra fulgida]